MKVVKGNTFFKRIYFLINSRRRWIPFIYFGNKNMHRKVFYTSILIVYIQFYESSKPYIKAKLPIYIYKFENKKIALRYTKTPDSTGVWSDTSLCIDNMVGVR